MPLDIRDEEDIALVLHHADYIVQHGEDLEPKQPKDDVSVDIFCVKFRMHVYIRCRAPVYFRSGGSTRDFIVKLVGRIGWL